MGLRVWGTKKEFLFFILCSLIIFKFEEVLLLLQSEKNEILETCHL